MSPADAPALCREISVDITNGRFPEKDTEREQERRKRVIKREREQKRERERCEET